MANPLPNENGRIVGTDIETANQGQDSAAPGQAPRDSNSNNPKTINWLNGSYAGADIKVVAHLYGELNRDEEIEKLATQAETERNVARGAQNLQSTPGSYFLGASSLRRSEYGAVIDAFKRQAGITDPVAMNTLFSELYETFQDAVRTGARDNLLWGTTEVIKNHEAVADSIEAKATTMQDSHKLGSSTCTLEQCQTLSVQSFREKVAVRSLGKSYVSGHTRGPRTIGGSMIFSLIKEHPLTRLIRAMGNAGLFGETQYDLGIATLIPDQLPPIDLTIVFANEYGAISKMGIYGVEFFTDGMTLSSEDLLTEVVMQFVARDIDIPSSVGTMKMSQAERGLYNDDGKRVTGDDVSMSSRDAYTKYLDKIGMRYMFKGR